jgi:DNA-3-methyladenine glycosylase II
MDLEHALLHLKKQDVQLGTIINRLPVPVWQPSRNVYLDLLDSIVSQQLSTKVATVIFNRFCALFPENYPHAELLAEIDAERLRSAGLSGQKAAYLRNVAHFALARPFEGHGWDELSDAEILALLTAIKGVGPWTVQMLLMFTLGRPDVFPVDDLGIQQAMSRLYGLEERGAALKKRMIELAEPWRPYRTVACRYLWRWKDANVQNGNAIDTGK